MVNPRPQENRGIGSGAAVGVAHRNRPTPQWPQHCGCVTQKQPHSAWHGLGYEVAIFEDIQLTNEIWCRSDATPQDIQDAIPRSLAVRPWQAAWARGEGRGESGHPTGEGVARSRQGATAIEGTSCGLGAKLEGAAVGAYAEKYRFAPGFSVGCGELEKHLIASRSRRSVPILRSCMESPALCRWILRSDAGDRHPCCRSTCNVPTGEEGHLKHRRPI
jgi:hypothetical protein